MAGQTCRDPDTGRLIAGYELGVLTRDDERRFELHLLECAHCLEELYRMDPVRARLGGAPRSAVMPKTKAGEPPVAPARRRPGVRMLVGSAAAAIVLVALLGVLAPWEIGESDSPRFRGTARGGVLLLAPVGEVTRPWQVDWEPIPDAERYVVTIRSASGEVIWKESATAPPLALPELVREGLVRGQGHVWNVEAIGADGQQWTSEPTRFRVVD